MKPCIFLDIDWVINPSRKKNSYCLDYNLPDVLAKKLNHPKIATLNAYLVNQVYYCFSKESIQLLKQLIEKYDAQIIITSSWRIVYSLEQLQTMFDIFDLGKYVKSVTTLINPRTKAIQEFINENNVTSYIVLDDFDMSNAFDYHFVYVRHYFKDLDYKKADYALFIQQKELSNWKNTYLPFLQFVTCYWYFTFPVKTQTNPPKQVPGFYNFYHFLCMLFVNSHILQFMLC